MRADAIPRVQAELELIHKRLDAQRRRLETLTDPQYKLLNEVVLTVIQNTEQEKIEFLRRAVYRTLSADDLSHTDAAQVSRALRDMTEGEMIFMLDHIESEFMIGPVTGDLEERIHLVDSSSEEMAYLSGLIGLGVIVPRGSSMDDGGRYVFAPFCRKLCELIRVAA